MDALGLIIKPILGAILISCAFGSLCVAMQWIQPFPAYKSPVSLSGITTAPSGVKKGDFYMPELNMTDAPRPVGYSYEVVDKDPSQKQIDFPMGQ